ncbi:hypothetical protein PT974_05890 [Cladobotryum mycophilum]|uniref:Uncharacterized protein n=1 Tax=Cladobotryum mycophilum TaxID=491253 RepID=A0ABR0SK16_9HYPO
MSAIAKPRYSRMQAGQLRPARQRFGIINYARVGDAAAEESRRWYNLRAATKFCVQDVRPVEKGKGKGKGMGKVNTSRAVTETWVWDAIREKIAKRAAAEKSV